MCIGFREAVVAKDVIAWKHVDTGVVVVVIGTPAEQALVLVVSVVIICRDDALLDESVLRDTAEEVGGHGDL
jgi:hypothetical protein